MRIALLIAVAAAIVGLTAAPATAGNIALTGHDDDFHCAAGSAAGCAQYAALLSFVRNGSALPVLTFDSGLEVTSRLTALGIPFTNVDPNNAAAVTDALFSNSLFSAFIVASDTSCGGCDNSPAGEANIASHSAAIDSFLNAGGGILGFAGAGSADYYAFVPQIAISVGGAPSSGYSQTTVGATFGIPAVNGDATHNLFFNPGTSGESAFFQIAEVNAIGNGTILPPAATTLLCNGCTVSGGVISGGGGGAPEPATYFFMTGGLACLAICKKFRTRTR
jgi:hypothetical protein